MSITVTFFHLKMLGSIANAIIAYIDTSLDSIFPSPEMNRILLDQLNDAKKTAKNIQIKMAEIVIAKQNVNLEEIYKSGIYELSSICDAVVKTLAVLQKYQNTDGIAESIRVLQGYIKGLSEKLEEM